MYENAGNKTKMEESIKKLVHDLMIRKLCQEIFTGFSVGPFPKECNRRMCWTLGRRHASVVGHVKRDNSEIT